MPNPVYLYVLGSLVVACSVKVPRLPVKGESLAASAFTVEIGGKGFNLALGSLRLGADVRGLLPCGDDLFGELARRGVEAAGLSPDMVRRFAGATGSGIGFAEPGGDNALAIFAGANRLPAAADIREEESVIAGAAMVLAQFELGDAAIAEGFAIARAAGVPTLLNPSPYRPISAEILARTSILVVNEVEAADLARQAGLDAPSQTEGWHSAFPVLAKAMRDQGIGTLVVTLGGDGVLAGNGGEPLYQAAFRVKAIDALGAGDAFTAGLAVSLSEGRPMRDALRRGAACGALAVVKLGVYEALPWRAEMEALIA